MDVKQELAKQVNKLMDFVIDKLKSNKEFMAGMSVGAFLMTPAGKTMLREAKKYTTSIAKLTKEVGAETASAVWNQACNSKLGKTNLIQNAVAGEGKTGKFATGVAKVSAAMAAGKILGASLGKTIAAGSNWWQHLNPVSMTVDTVQVLKEEAQEKKANNLKANQPIKELAENLDKYSAEGEPNKISVYTGYNYDEAASKLGISKRPSAAPAENEWKKEVERRMKTNSNHPSWYGKFPEFLTTNINYGVRKEGEYFDVAIGANIKCEQTLPLKKKVLSQGYIDQMNVLYAKLRGSNSGAFNYSVKDLMNYIESVRGIKILLRMMARNLKSINNIDFYVNKSPEPFMTVLGMDATGIADVRDNRARYIAKYNHLVELVNATFPLPPQMTVFDRDAYLASIILMDSKGPKASLYAYNYYVTLMAANGTGNEGKLEQNVLTTNNVASIEYNIDNAIARAHGYVSADYSGVETFAKIAGDIIKAYGQSAFGYRHENISLNDKNQTVYDEYLLHQLQNAQALSLTQGNALLTSGNFVPTAVAYTTKIKIDGNASHTLPAAWIPCNSYAGSNPVIVNTNKSNVTALETISLTRGNWFFEFIGSTLTYGTTYTVEVDTCDTVALYGMDIIFFSTSGNISSFTISSTGFTVANGVGERALLAQLDYAPCVHTFDDRNNWAYDAVYEDLDTYGYMTVEQYRTLTDVAVISMYKTVNISDQVNFKAAKK